MNKQAIVIDRCSFSYGTKKVLDNVSFFVQEGEYVSIIGSNGAGKSTLLKCINRIIKGATGSIEILGKPLSQYTQKELAQKVSYVSQNHDQVFPYTVYEFVLMGRYPYLSPFSRISKKDKEAVEEALALTGSSQFIHRKVFSLSGGERQKVYLAGALVQEPRILLLDEPTTHLDPKYQIEIQKTIINICSKLRIAVLHVTHDLAHLFFWSHKILALKSGQLIFNGIPEDILNDENLKTIFDAEFLLAAHPSSNQKIILPKVIL